MQPKKSGLCVAGFITSLVQFITLGFLSPLSMILSICGVVSCRGGRKTGKGLGIAGIIISVFGIIFMCFWLTMMGTMLDKYRDEVKKDKTGRHAGSSKVIDDEDEDDEDEDDVKDTDVDDDDYDDDYDDTSSRIYKDFGSYEISSDWVEAQDDGLNGVYYCHEGDEYELQPNNIMVRYGTNKYSKDDVMSFKAAIQTQLLQQFQDIPANIGGGGSYTDNGYDLIRFEITPDEQDEKTPGRCVQYYIVGDYEYVMVSVMVWDLDKEESDGCAECAKAIVHSFLWDEE